MFMQLLINGLIAGAIYALVASGFSIIYKTNKFVHFAHGGIVAIGGYSLYLFYSLLKINFWISIIFSILTTITIGIIINNIYLKLRKRNASSTIMLIASVSLLTTIEALILLIFHADVKTIGFIKITKGMSILGAMITPLQVIIIALAIALLGFLLWLMKYTRIGKELRAVSDNKDLSEIIGINTKKVYAYSFIIGSILGAIAGILIALEQNLEPTIGTNLIIKGFTASIIGGVSSVPGSIIGGFLIGIIENFGIWFLPSAYKDAITFALLFIFLLFKHNGLFGLKKGIKK